MEFVGDKALIHGLRLWRKLDKEVHLIADTHLNCWIVYSRKKGSQQSAQEWKSIKSGNKFADHKQSIDHEIQQKISSIIGSICYIYTLYYIISWDLEGINSLGNITLGVGRWCIFLLEGVSSQVRLLVWSLRSIITVSSFFPFSCLFTLTASHVLGYSDSQSGSLWTVCCLMYI